MSGPQRAPSRSDIALSAVLTAVCVAELFVDYAFERTDEQGPTAFHVGVAVVVGAALAWRRVYPLLVAPLVFAVLAAQSVAVAQPNVYGEIIVAIVALYTVSAHAPSLRPAAGSAVVALGFGVLLAANDPEDPVGAAVTMVIFGGVVLLAGVVVRRQRDRTEQMRQARDEAERQAREIATIERTRIARELHDVVAHGMSVVVLQARGGRRKLDSEPSRARQAFDDIEGVAAECLDEMRRLLEILRDADPDADPDAAPLAPQPKLSELPALVEQARASGTPTDLVVEGARRDLGPAIELSAYRIAQEALTNTLKHAPGSRVRLRLTYESDAVAIEVVDDGPGMTEGRVGGHGLIGMRERVELFGGTLAAADEPGGGFGVRARLPLTGTAT